MYLSLLKVKHLDIVKMYESDVWKCLNQMNHSVSCYVPKYILSSENFKGSNVIKQKLLTEISLFDEAAITGTCPLFILWQITEFIKIN